MRLGWLATTVTVACTMCACGGTQPQATNVPPAASAAGPQADNGDDDDDGTPHLHGFLAGMDQNKDGKVTLDEAKAAAAANFAQADANKDGELDANEMREMHKGRMAQAGGKRGMARLDKDGNGTLSRDEAPPRLLEHFDEFDANHDGQIDRQEMMAMRKGHGPGPGPHPGPGAGHGPGPGPGAGPGPGHQPGARMDANGDGKISAAEHADGVEKMFKMMDMDGDGAITEADIKAARERHQKK